MRSDQSRGGRVRNEKQPKGTIMKRTSILAIAVAVAGAPGLLQAVPAVAAATPPTVSKVGSTLTYVATADDNHVVIAKGPYTIVFSDTAVSLTPGVGCWRGSTAHVVICSDGGVTAVVVDGAAGNDFLASFIPGSVRFYGGDGDDTLAGGPGKDTLVGGPGDDGLSGGGGTDSVSYASSIRTVYAQIGGIGGEARDCDLSSDPVRYESDTISADVENLLGGAADDCLFGSSTSNALYGLGGSDRLYGNGGRDYLDGGSDGDGLYGGPGNDTLHDLVGDNLLQGGDGADTLTAGSGADVLRGDNAYSDPVYEHAGNDKLDGGTGNDSLYGGDGTDVLHGRAGDDLLAGEYSDVFLDEGSSAEAGGDLLYGDAGNDHLYGGWGFNLLFGGTGVDVCDVGEGGAKSGC
jgi:Ca2+-binding RTX toxin-like protein